MNELFYNYTNDKGTESLTVHGAGISAVVPGSHPRFRVLLHYLQNRKSPDPEYIKKMLDVGGALMEGLQGSGSGRVSFDGSNLRFDGEVIDTSLARHIVRMMREEDANYDRWVRFLESLSENPSNASQEHLFTWLARRDFAITPEGHLLGYKGVQANANNSSIHTGTAFVNGTKHQGHIPNPVGAVVTMPRAKVSDNRDAGCSTGLHVGTYAFAKSFGQRLLLVAVSPRDVVSVPRDSEYQKLRCCQYTVLTVHEGPPVASTSFDLRDIEEVDFESGFFDDDDSDF